MEKIPIATTLIAFVRKHYISKGVRKIIRDEKTKIVLYPEVGQLFVEKRRKSWVKSCVKSCETKEERLCCLILTFFLSNQSGI